MGAAEAKPTNMVSKEAYSGITMTETDVAKFRYYVKVLERGLRDHNEDGITCIFNECAGRHFLEEGLYAIACSANNLVKEMRTRERTLAVYLRRNNAYKNQLDRYQQEREKAKEDLFERDKENLKVRLVNALEETEKLRGSAIRFTQLLEEKRRAEERQKETEKKMRENNLELNRTQTNLSKAEDDMGKLQEKLRNAHEEISHLKESLSRVQKATRTEEERFKLVKAHQQTNNNPDIAEISDENRPTKLAERFSELYKNEWTDAFSAIEDDTRNEASEEDVVTKLKDIVLNCFKECVDISNKQLANIEATLFNPGSGKQTTASRQLTTKQTMAITDLRREISTFSIENIKEEMCRRFGESTKYRDLKLFIEKCSDLCWLMVVQSPPVLIDGRHRPGDRFDGDIFKSYTESGDVIEFVVWPPVYLHEGGPLLSKGIAQGRK